MRACVVAWLVGSRLDHARFLAMDERFARAPVYGLAIGGCTAVAAPTYGAALVGLVLLAGVTVVAGKVAQSRARHPGVYSLSWTRNGYAARPTICVMSR